MAHSTRNGVRMCLFRFHQKNFTYSSISPRIPKFCHL